MSSIEAPGQESARSDTPNSIQTQSSSAGRPSQRSPQSQGSLTTHSPQEQRHTIKRSCKRPDAESRNLTSNLLHGPSIASSPPAERAPPTKTEQYLIDLALDFWVAVNARNFDAKTWPWTQIAPDFIAGRTFATVPAEITLAELLRYHSKIYLSKPKYYVNPTETVATVSEKTGKATVFANLENINFTPGVVRYSVARFEFRGEGSGKWKVFAYSSMPVGESPG